MPWFRADHNRGDHPKWRAAVQVEPLATALWLNAGESIARAESDGVVRALLLADYAHRTAPGMATSKLRKCVEALVLPGLWHPHDSAYLECHCMGSQEEKNGRLPELVEGDFLYHDWFDFQLPKSDGDSITKQHELRKRRLHADVELVTKIRERDRDLCRYCGRVTRKIRGLTKSNDCQELDHVDPFGENTYENVAVSCRACNRRKGSRTPEQAGMPLLPPPDQYVLEVVK